MGGVQVYEGLAGLRRAADGLSEAQCALVLQRQDVSRTDDSFQTGLDILLAEREVDQTRERVLRSMRANAASGRPHGKLTYGYTREYDPRSGALVRQIIHEEQAVVVRESAKRVLAGESIASIAKDFNRRGIKAPRSAEWVPTQIKRILVNPAYIAQRVHQGKVIGKADWPPILDEVTFRRCVTRLTDPSRKFTDEHAAKYLLSGIAVCGVCGSTVKARPQRNGYFSYVCKSFCVARKMDCVDLLIETLVVARLSQPDAMLEDDEDTNPALEAIRDKRCRLEEFYDSAANGEISAAALARIEAKLLQEIEGLEKTLRRSAVPTSVHDLADNPEVWQSLPISVKREIIKLLMQVRIMKSERGRKVFDPNQIEIEWRHV